MFGQEDWIFALWFYFSYGREYEFRDHFQYESFQWEFPVSSQLDSGSITICSGLSVIDLLIANADAEIGRFTQSGECESGQIMVA